MRTLTILFAAASLAACSGGAVGMQPAAARAVDPGALAAAAGPASLSQYRIGPMDLLSVNVFDVPALSVTEARVDASGNVQLPLLGSLRAAGKTADELATEIESQLASTYLQAPQVSLRISEAASQKVTVDGAVEKPGVYVMQGRTTLLQAVAMAEGPNRLANLEQVAVFRSTPEGRMVAVFDLNAIRSGEAPDPTLMGEDVVVVDTSRLSAVTRTALELLPGVAAVFRYW